MRQGNGSNNQTLSAQHTNYRVQFEHLINLDGLILNFQLGNGKAFLRKEMKSKGETKE